MPLDSNLINVFLDNIISQVNSGFALVIPHVMLLFRSLIVISLIFHGLRAAYSDEPFFNGFMMKILYIGFFVYIFQNWQSLTEIVMKSFATLGIQAGGGSLTMADLLNPWKVATIGWDLFYKLLLHSIDLSGIYGFLENAPGILIFFVAGVVVLACFIIMAIQVFITVVSFKIVTLAAVVLIPFGLWRGTSFLAERAIGYVFSAGIRMMVLSIVVSLGTALFTGITLGATPTYQEAFGVVLGSLTFLVFCFYAPSLASDLVTGGPSLGAGAAMATAIPTAIATAGAAKAMTSAVSTLVKTVQRLSTQQKVSQVAQAAQAGMGGPSSPGYRPSPPPSGGGGSGGSAQLAGRMGSPTTPSKGGQNAAAPGGGNSPSAAGAGGSGSGLKFTAEDAARFIRKPQTAQASGASGAGTGGSGSNGASGQLRGAGKAQPVAKTMPNKAGGVFANARQGSTRGFMEGVRSASRDGDGGGGMQASIKHPDEG